MGARIKPYGVRNGKHLTSGPFSMLLLSRPRTHPQDTILLPNNVILQRSRQHSIFLLVVFKNELSDDN
jgi:hypothetical protein